MSRIGILLLGFIFSLSLNQSAFADNNFVKRPDVQAFIQKMVKKHHFKVSYLNALFNDVKVYPQVMHHIRKPLEKESWHTYQMLFVNEWRIKHGVMFWNKYADALRRAQEIYGVPPSIIVATIGVETKYGERTGNFRVIDSLSNIAFSRSTRANFFRSELEEFLLLARDQKLDPLKIKGSYAGAIGQPQFMPSSYRHYAVNFSKSGKIDLMNNEVDVIGSIANYYHQHGWLSNKPVVVPAEMIGYRYNYFFHSQIPYQPLTIGELSKYGIHPKVNIKDDDLKVKVVELPSYYSKEYWLGFRNFDVIKRYNSSDLYAMAVYQLSYFINERKGQTHG